MSKPNNADNFNLTEHSDNRNEAATNFNHTEMNEDTNNEYFISLLNNSTDSDNGRGTKENTSPIYSELSDFGKTKDENTSAIQKESENSPRLNSVTSSCNTGIDDNVINNMQKRKEYRDSDSSWTEDEDSSSTSSSDSDFLFEKMPQSSSPKVSTVKTKGELDIEDLPPIEYLKISVEEKDLKKVGKVHAIVIKLVVIKATKDEKPLDVDSVLFLGPNEPLGRIFEVFGPVIEPFYTVLFNSPEDIIEQGVKVGSEVFYAPLKDEITSYVFVDILRQQKGSDASWKDNNEPPEEHLDYSDDEQERAARLKRKAKNRVRESDDDEVQIIPYKVSPNEKRTFDYTSYTRNKNFEMQNIRNSTQYNRNCIQNNTNSTQYNRNCIQNNTNSILNNKNNLENIPVWISTPPPYLEPKPLPSQASVANTSTVQSFQLKQPVPLPTQNQLHPVNAPSSSQTQFNSGALILNPKQPYIPRQPLNLNSPRVAFLPQTPTPVNNVGYFLPSRPPQPIQLNRNLFLHSPQRPPQQNTTQVMYQNVNQHVFGQITPVGVMSPAPPMSPAIFSSPPSPALYVPPSTYSPLPSPALSPHPFWRPPNQQPPSFNNVRVSPSPTTPLTIQIPTFSSPPPTVHFTTASNSVPPPVYNNFSTPRPYQYPGRF